MQSYYLLRGLFYEPHCGIAFPDNFEEAEAFGAMLKQELEREGLDSTLTGKSYGVGLGAAGGEAVFWFLGSIVAIATGVKAIDDAIPVIRSGREPCAPRSRGWKAIERCRLRP